MMAANIESVRGDIIEKRNTYIKAVQNAVTELISALNFGELFVFSTTAENTYVTIQRIGKSINTATVHARINHPIASHKPIGLMLPVR